MQNKKKQKHPGDHKQENGSANCGTRKQQSMTEQLKTRTTETRNNMVNLETINVSKKSLTQKSTYGMIPFMWNSQRNKSNLQQGNKAKQWLPLVFQATDSEGARRIFRSLIGGFELHKCMHLSKLKQSTVKICVRYDL